MAYDYRRSTYRPSRYRRRPKPRYSPLRRLGIALLVLTAVGLFWSLQFGPSGVEPVETAIEEPVFDLVSIVPERSENQPPQPFLQEPAVEQAEKPAKMPDITPAKEPVSEPDAQRSQQVGVDVAERPPVPETGDTTVRDQKVADHASPSGKIQAAINAARKKAGRVPLAENRVLQTVAQRGAIAMIRAVHHNPVNPKTPDELNLDQIDKGLPAAARLFLAVPAAHTINELAEKAARSKAARKAEFTHLGVGVADGSFDTGLQFHLAVILAAEILPGISPELVNQGRREFHIRCHLCGREYLAVLRRPSGKHAGSLQVLCPKCNRGIDLFGLDTSQCYHRPPWFMRGFSPKKISSPLTAWLFVLSRCRYVDDRMQYGRDEVWQTAAETYRKRQGDCEDTSILLADWLASSGYKARAVIGQKGSGGHAWVVVHGGGRDYILETTGGRGDYRRVPPRSTVTTRYLPYAQFDRTGIWFRTSNKWTSDYHGKDQWSRGPWPLERVPTKKSKTGGDHG